ncbi:hypothetical protein D3C74_07220 [compost metagenome]
MIWLKVYKHQYPMNLLLVLNCNDASRYVKLNEVTTAPKFQDVAADAVYADAIAEATHAGFIQGYGGNFIPNHDITREEAATIY